MSEFQETTLEAVCQSIDYGLTASAQDKPSDYKFLRITDIVSNQINWSSVPYVSVDPGEAEKYLLNDDDIVIARTGATTGYSAYIQNAPKTVFASYLVRYKVKPEYNARYISYCLKSTQWWSYIQGVLGDKSAQPNASASTMAKFRFKELSRKDQDAIAQILGDIDDKIILNQRMNETLEAMARALFKSWFVDFDPVRAKAEGRTPEGMDAATAALFPSTFNDDGLPEGWVIKKLSEVTSELRRGVSPKYLDIGGIQVINQKCIRDGVVSFVPSRRHDHISKSVEGRLIMTGDVLVNSTGVGTLGRVAQIWMLKEPTIVDSHVTVVRAEKTKVTALYLGLNLLTRQSEIEGLGEGSTGQTELSRVRLGNLDLISPPLILLNRFDNILRPLIEKISLNQTENICLSELRDALLPKLISGELRIGDIKSSIRRVS